MGRYVGELGTDVYGVTLDEVKRGKIEWTAAQAAAEAAVHAAVTGSATVTVTTTTGFTQPSCPRNLKITPGGTTADVKEGSITVYGTNYADEAISEAFAFAANATAATVGAKAFKTVTSMVIPAQDAGAATFALATGSKLGLPLKLANNCASDALFGTAKDSALPTMAFSSSALESNTATFATALDGTALQLILDL